MHDSVSNKFMIVQFVLRPNYSIFLNITNFTASFQLFFMNRSSLLSFFLPLLRLDMKKEKIANYLVIGVMFDWHQTCIRLDPNRRLTSIESSHKLVLLVNDLYSILKWIGLNSVYFRFYSSFFKREKTLEKMLF
jgi:hypothetical protein